MELTLLPIGPRGRGPAAPAVTTSAPGPAIGSLCTGYGGLDLAVLTVLGGHLTWVAENDRHATAILAARFPQAANLGDITAADWTTVPPVDVLTAGFPCQDISQAGKRIGIEGTRSGIWTHVAQAVRVLHPGLLVVENVAALRNRGLDRVLGDLAQAGYDAIWRCVRASDVGAPHRRERLFLLGWPAAEPGLADLVRGPGRCGDEDHPTAAHPDGGGRAGRDRPRCPQGRPASGRSPRCHPVPAGHPSHAASLTRSPANRASTAGSATAFRAAIAPLSGIPGEITTDGVRASLGSGHRQHAGAASAADADRADDMANPARAHDLAAAQWQDAALRLASHGRLAADPAGLGRGRGLTQPARLPRPVDADLGDRAPSRAPDSQESAQLEPDAGGRSQPSAVVDWGPYEPAIRRWELVLGLPVPVPTEPARGGGRRLRAAFVEWIMGLVPGFVTGLDQVPRAAQLRALGNGVVPQQAVYAITLLAADLAEALRDPAGQAGTADGMAA